jgi:predicted XRE-type DNA-binding protein
MNMTSQTYENVWDALEDNPAEAANMTARSDLMIALQDVIAAWGLTQAESAKRLGISQPRLNDLLKGRIGKFSLDAQMILAAAAGPTVKIEVEKPAA